MCKRFKRINQQYQKKCASILISTPKLQYFVFKGITEEFITALFYFYRSMGELNVTETEYALLVATTVFFSGN